MQEFRLDQQLAHDCHPVGNLDLSQALLFDDCRYPWVILVPRRIGAREIYQLVAADRRQLLDESCRLAEFLVDAFPGAKLNIAALGNIVGQLHLHHVVRQTTDPAWPGPVWGHSPPVPYSAVALETRLRLLRDGLGLSD